jgi:hypothetical protein
MLPIVAKKARIQLAILSGGWAGVSDLFFLPVSKLWVPILAFFARAGTMLPIPRAVHAQRTASNLWRAASALYYSFVLSPWCLDPLSMQLGSIRNPNDAFIMKKKYSPVSRRYSIFSSTSVICPIPIARAQETIDFRNKKGRPQAARLLRLIAKRRRLELVSRHRLGNFWLRCMRAIAIAVAIRLGQSAQRNEAVLRLHRLFLEHDLAI